jgi:hypothetical protein
MIKKFSLSATIIFFLFSCSSRVLIPEDKMKFMEVEDHNFCLAQGIGTHNLDMDNQLYWECRTAMAKDRMVVNPKMSEDIQFNTQMKKVVKVLQLRADRSRNANLAVLGNDYETFDNEYCLMRGYSPESVYPQDIEAYYDCRTEALLNRTTIAPFAIGSYTYQKGEIYKKQADTMPLLRNLRDEKEIDNSQVITGSDVEPTVYEEAIRVSKIINDYPVCSKFKYDSKDFKECINNYQEYTKCVDDIPSKIAKRKLSDTIFCTKQSVKQFPDEIAIYKEGEDSDTGPKFSKLETVKLRSQFNQRCRIEREEKLVEYANKLPEACKASVKKWEK